MKAARILGESRAHMWTHARQRRTTMVLFQGTPPLRLRLLALALFLNMSRYSGGTDAEFWLEAWCGGHYRVERMNRPAQPPSAIARRTASSWIEGVGRLHHQHRPTDIHPHRWRQFLGDCNNFLASGDNWADRAAGLGWETLTLFGYRPHRPLLHHGSAGLLWAINGGRLLELHREWAVIERSANGSQRIFDRRNIDAASFRVPWAGPEPA
jgi:hypothetical protein